MERIGYTRLYATVSGAALVLLGLGGLLENAQFDFPELTSDLLGFYTVNGWANVFHVAIGLLALVMARRLSRLYALLAAVIFLGLGIWGVTATDGELLFSKLPAMRAVNGLNLLLGIAALGCLVAGYWDRVRAFVANRREKRRTGTSRRERRRRLKRQKKKLSSENATPKRAKPGDPKADAAKPGSAKPPASKTGS